VLIGALNLAFGHIEQRWEAPEAIDVLVAQLAVVCSEISNGPQSYSEANPPEGWAKRFIADAQFLQR
jgi:hypothetical protein